MQKHETLGPVLVFHEKEMTYVGEPTSTLARVVGIETAKTMGAAFATFDNCSVEWTVRYDEVVYVIEGTFRLKVNGEARECHAGDVLWIPENTPLIYEGEGAKVLFVISPGDWRERHGIPPL